MPELGSKCMFTMGMGAVELESRHSSDGQVKGQKVQGSGIVDVGASYNRQFHRSL